MSDDKMLLVEKALETAKKYGAQDARASIGVSQSNDITWRAKKVENMSSSVSESLGISLFVDGRFSEHSTSDLRPEAIDAFIKRGVDVTRLLEPDEFRGLPDPKYYEGRTTADLETYDPAVEKITATDLIRDSRELEELTLAHSDAPIQDVTTGASASFYHSWMASTNGFSGSRRSTSVSNYAEVVLKTPDGKLPSDYEFSSTRYRSDLLPSQKVADTAVARALRHVGQKKLPTKSRTVLFDNRAIRTFFNHYYTQLWGASIDQKQSYFLDKIGKKCGPDLLTVVDMPHLPRGLSSRAYDSEGMTTNDRTLFENGVLKMYYLSVYYARKLGLEPTTTTQTNLVFPASRTGKSQEELIRGIDDGILVTSLIGGNKDAVRGDFSFGIAGVAIEKGELTTPVSEMNINGNFTTFWDGLSAIGNDINLYSSFMFPSIRVDGVLFSGS